MMKGLISMKKDDNASTKIRNDITSLLKAIRPQFIRESALTQLLQRVVNQNDEKPQYTIGNIRAVYNSYAGRSGSVHIPYVQGVKVGASNYYTYSRFEHTEPTSLTIDEKILENNSFLFIKKDTNHFFFLEGATEENEEVIEKFQISNYSFLNEEDDALKEDQTRFLMRILTIQQLLSEIFNSQKKAYIAELDLIQNIYELLEIKGFNNLFQDKFIDENDFNDDAQLELENIKECIELVISIDNNYHFNDDKTLILNNTSFEQHDEEADFYLLEQNLKNTLLQIKKLQIEAIENNDIQLMINLKSLKKIEKSITRYFNY